MQSWATFLCYCVVCLVTQLCPTLCSLMSCSLPDPYDHGIFFRQEYWSGWPFHPPRNLFIQWLDLGHLCLLHCKRILYPLSHQGSRGPDLIPFPRHWQDSWVHLMRAWFIKLRRHWRTSHPVGLGSWSIFLWESWGQWYLNNNSSN